MPCQPGLMPSASMRISSPVGPWVMTARPTLWPSAFTRVASPKSPSGARVSGPPREAQAPVARAAASAAAVAIFRVGSVMPLPPLTSLSAQPRAFAPAGPGC